MAVGRESSCILEYSNDALFLFVFSPRLPSPISDLIFTNRSVLTLRGFVKLKKSEKNSEVDWWVFSFFENVVFFVLFVFFCCCTCFQKNIKLNGGWMGSDQFVFISDFFILFNLTKTLNYLCKNYADLRICRAQNHHK